MSGELAWITVAIADIRRRLDEFDTRLTRVHEVQEDLAKKEYAAGLVFRFAHRAARILVWVGVAVGGYALNNWIRVKATVDGFIHH